MRPTVALLGNSIFITTVSTSLRSRIELSVEQLYPSCPTILEQLRELCPNALILDPIVACPKHRESILSAFAKELTQPVALFEFCNNNKQLYWRIILPARHSLDENTLELLAKDGLRPEKRFNKDIQPEAEPHSYDIACIESLVRAITEVCRNIMNDNEPPGYTCGMDQKRIATIPKKQIPDDALLRSCRMGDAQAWEALLDRYERLVFSIARNTGLGSEDAADITQLTFGYLLQSLDRMTDEGNLRAWLATVAKRHSRRLLVRQLRYQSTEIDEEVINDLMPNRTEAGGIERWELAEWIRAGLERIDERCRNLLRALYLDEAEASYAEIAKAHGLAEGSIGPIRARCLKRLREVHP